MDPRGEFHRTVEFLIREMHICSSNSEINHTIMTFSIDATVFVCKYTMVQGQCTSLINKKVYFLQITLQHPINHITNPEVLFLFYMCPKG